MRQPNPFETFKSNQTNEMTTASEQFAVHSANDAATPLFSSLNKFNQSKTLQLVENLALENYEAVLSFGQDTQLALKNFSAQMLYQIQKKDVSQVRTVLHDLLMHLEQIDPDALVEEERSLLKRIFSRPKQSTQEVMTQYNKLSKRIDRLGIQLSHAQTSLLQDIQSLDKFYVKNEDYFQEINLYIAALEIKKCLLEQTIPALQKQVADSQDFFDQQQLQDAHMQLEWLDRRMYDLELSREIAIQYAPQIRLIQQTNHLLIDKIQSSILTTIPLWQSQIAVLLNVNKQRRAMQNEQRMLEAHEQMVKKNQSALLHTVSSGQHQLANLKQTQQRLLDEITITLSMEEANAVNRHTAEQLLAKED